MENFEDLGIFSEIGMSPVTFGQMLLKNLKDFARTKCAFGPAGVSAVPLLDGKRQKHVFASQEFRLYI